MIKSVIFQYYVFEFLGPITTSKVLRYSYLDLT